MSDLDFWRLVKLSHGKHDRPEDGVCVMELVSLLAGEEFTDWPECSSRVITRLCQGLNDQWDGKQREQLRPYILRIVGTAPDMTTDGAWIERRRAYLCADWAVRERLPATMDLLGMSEWAEQLRALQEVTDKSTAQAGHDMAIAVGHYADTYAAIYAAKAAIYAATAAINAAHAAAAAAVTDARADASVLTLLDRLIKVRPGPYEHALPPAEKLAAVRKAVCV